MCFAGFYRVLLGFTGCGSINWVLLGFTGFYWVLPSFTGFLCFATWFLKVQLGFNMFC